MENNTKKREMEIGGESVDEGIKKTNPKKKRSGKGREDRGQVLFSRCDPCDSTRLDAHKAEGQDPWPKAQKPRSNHDHPHDDLASERARAIQPVPFLVSRVQQQRVDRKN